MSGPHRVGMFGGAFDPPHMAHVALARAAVEQLGLDALRIFPTGQAWHKARALTAGEHRLAMAEEAFAAVPHAMVDGRELRRSGPTYTVDTLRELHDEHPDAELMLVMGADQAEAFRDWKDSAEIIRLATICIASRARPMPAAEPFDANKLTGVRWLPVELVPMPVSATEIRRRVAAGGDVSEWVPECVARYIAKHHLYQET